MESRREWPLGCRCRIVRKPLPGADKFLQTLRLQLYWELLGERAAETPHRDDLGWDYVFGERFAIAAG